MKTTDFRPVFMGPVDLRDAKALRDAIRELENALLTLEERPFTFATLNQFALKEGCSKLQARNAYEFLTHAIYRRWAVLNPDKPPYDDRRRFMAAFNEDREARGLVPSVGNGLYFSEISAPYVKEVLGEHLKAVRITELVWAFLAAHGIEP